MSSDSGHPAQNSTLIDTREISREALIALPLHRYEGPVHWVATASEAEQAMADIGAEHVTGFDTETRPAFRKGESHLPAIAQVATARAVYIFALRAAEVHAALKTLLEAPGITKAGVALAHDLRTLKQRFEFNEQGIIDLGLVARKHGSRQTGVRNLAGLYMGIRIPKGATTSNWAAPKLTDAQINYAATDAWVCRELYLQLETKGWLRS